jgi:hypothetical protein
MNLKIRDILDILDVCLLVNYTVGWLGLFVWGSMVQNSFMQKVTVKT